MSLNKLMWLFIFYFKNYIEYLESQVDCRHRLSASLLQTSVAELSIVAASKTIETQLALALSIAFL